MGLFSRKNKQDRVAEDSGRFYSKDDDAAIGERARAKRASNAGGGATRRPGSDPLLPEKKRARRRLVGAIALALAAAVGLPMLLDSEPKPLAGDIAIQIPSKDKAAPLPVPGAPAADKQVAAEDSVGKDEEIVDPAGVATPADAPKAASRADAAARPEPKPEPVKPEPVKPEARATAAERDDKAAARLAAEKAERQRADKAERERLEKAERDRADKAERAEKLRAEKQRAEEKARDEKAREEKAREEKAREERAAKARLDDKPAKPAHSDARAVAILEGKAAGKDKPSESGGQKVVLQVAAMSSQDKAAEVQARLREAGISSYTQKSGDLIKVKIGPLNKDDADRMRAKLGKLGLSGFAVPS